MKHVSPMEYDAMLHEAQSYFVVHNFLEWLQDNRAAIAVQDEHVRVELAEIEALLLAEKEATPTQNH